MSKSSPFLASLSIGLLGMTLALPARSQLYQVYPKTNPNDPNEELQ